MSHQTLVLVDSGNSAIKFQSLRVSVQHLDRTQALFERLQTGPIVRLDNIEVTVECLMSAWKPADTVEPLYLSWVSVGPQAVQQAVRTAFKRLSNREAPDPWQPCPEVLFKDIDLRCFENRYVIAEQLGADRWVSMLGLACQNVIAPGETHMVISAGTATTVDLVRVDVNHKATFIGGWILPGIGLMNDALRRKTRDLDGLMGAEKETPIDVDLEPPTDSRSAISLGIGLAQTGFIGQVARQHHVTKLWLHGGYATHWRSYLSVLGKESGIALTVHEAPHLAFAGLLALERYRV